MLKTTHPGTQNRPNLRNLIGLIKLNTQILLVYFRQFLLIFQLSLIVTFIQYFSQKNLAQNESTESPEATDTFQ